MLTEDRSNEIAHAISRITDWATHSADVLAVAIVGSVARGDARTDSDVDVVVLTNQAALYIDTEAWILEALNEKAPIVRSQSWGVLFERRVRLSSGLDVEFGFAAPTWASTEPVDAGTRRVISEGCQPIFDPEGLMERLMEVVRFEG